MSGLDQLQAQAVDLGGVTLIAREVPAASVDDLRSAAMALRARYSPSQAVVVALGAVINDKPMLVVALNEAAREAGVKAGALVKAGSAAMDGGGGGKDDLAQGGGAPGGDLELGLQAVVQAVKTR